MRLLFLILMLWLPWGPATAETAAALDREAAHLLASGDLTGALEKYRRAEAQSPDPVRRGRMARIQALLQARRASAFPFGEQPPASDDQVLKVPEPLPREILLAVELPDFEPLYRSVVAGELGLARALLVNLYELDGALRGRLDRVLDKYWYFPAPEVRDYFRRLNPLLYRALVLKGRITEALTAWSEAAALAEAALQWRDETQARGALARLEHRRRNLELLLEGLDQVRAEIEALGPPPDPEALQRKAQAEFDRGLGVRKSATGDAGGEEIHVTQKMPLLRPFGYGHVTVEVPVWLREQAQYFTTSASGGGAKWVWLNREAYRPARSELEETDESDWRLRLLAKDGFVYDGQARLEFFLVGEVPLEFSIAFHRVAPGPDGKPMADRMAEGRWKASSLGAETAPDGTFDPTAYQEALRRWQQSSAQWSPDQFRHKSTAEEKWELYDIQRLPYPFSSEGAIRLRALVDLTPALEGVAPDGIERALRKAFVERVQKWEGDLWGPGFLYGWEPPVHLAGFPAGPFLDGYLVLSKGDASNPMVMPDLTEARRRQGKAHHFGWVLYLLTRNYNLIVIGGEATVPKGEIARFSTLRERVHSAAVELAAAMKPLDWDPKQVARFDLAAVLGRAQRPAERTADSATDPRAFYRLQIELLEEDLAAYRARLASASTPTERQALRYWILCKEADIQYQKDLLRQLETGRFERTPTRWDAYNAELMLRQGARQVRAAASADALYQDVARLARMLEREGDAQAGRWGLARARKALEEERDPRKLAKVKRLLQERLSARREQKQARAEEALALSEAALEAVENVAAGADWAMLSVTTAASATGLPGAQYIYAGYRGITRGLTDGVQAGVLQALSSVHAAGAVAVSAWEGYQAAEAQQQGSGLSGALIRGGTALAVIAGTRLAIRAATRAVKAGSDRFAQVRDMLLNREEREAATLMVKQYARDVRRLEQLVRKGDRGAAKKLLRKVQEQTISILSNPHAKNILKYGDDLLTQKAFNRFSGKIQRKVVRRFLEEMRARGWSEFQVTTFRNRFSAASVNMDWDLGLVEKAGMRLTRNGVEASVAEWQADANEVFAKVYKEVTGRTAAGAFAQVTSSVHPEAFPDLTILTNPEKAVWSKRIGEVIRYKFDDALHNTAGYIRKTGRYMEACRGLAKEIRAKLLPALRARRLEPPVIRRFEKLAQVLGDFGRGKTDLLHAAAEVRALTGRTLDRLPDLVIANLKTALGS